MPKASWNGVVVAEATPDAVHIVEGNTYFPPSAIHREFFKDSQTHTVCPWKGTASYYDLAVEGKINADAAWYYPETKEKARNIEGYVAFWRGVQVTD